MPPVLPPRQRAVLEAIEAFWAEHGVAPSLGDVAAMLGLSRQTVYEHVQILLKKGCLQNLDGAGRSWRPASISEAQTRRIPILGRIAAGTPVSAVENVEGWLNVDGTAYTGSLYALRVQGDSMTGAGILDGDLVIVRQQDTADDGDLVVALVDDEDATVKKFKQTGGMVHLIPMNPDYKPIVAPATRVRVQGKVVGVHRHLTG